MAEGDRALQPAAMAGAEAAQLFDSGLFCAESVLLALARRQGVDTGALGGIATGFCSGVGRTAGMCGAVSGAVMALGLAYGRTQPGDSVEPSYSAARRLVAGFEAEFGSINCAELLGCHIGTAEGQQAFREQRLGVRCRAYTKRAAEMAAALIDDPHMTA